MNDPTPKFLFDECALGKPAVDALAGLLRFAVAGSGAIIEHKLRFHNEGPGVWDEKWIPEAGKEGWIIVSADRGTRGGTKKGEKLPRVCREHNATHVLMSAGVKAQKQFDQILTILSVWYRLLETVSAIPGSCFSLEPVERGRGTLRLKTPGGASSESVSHSLAADSPTPKEKRAHRAKAKPKKKPQDKRQRRLFRE